MTRRDYILVSGALAKAREGVTDECELDGLDRAAQAVAKDMASQRSQFDVERFLHDSGVTQA